MANTATLIESKPNIMFGRVAVQAATHRQDLVEPAPFAPLRHNNKVDWFTTGESYFAALATAMKAAKKSICIAGWQVNWDVQLTKSERLVDILHDRICSSDEFRVFVMPWLSPKAGVNNHDFETMLAVFQLNAGRKKIQAMCCPAGEQSDFAGTEGAAFAHHQKLIVIDNETAFIGGMDLAYGRRDDNHFSLAPGARRLNERYSPGVPPSHVVDRQDGPTLSLMDLLSTMLSAGHWNWGGNSEPGALTRFLQHSLIGADALALEAVKLVNDAARLQYDRAKAAGHQAATAINATADAQARVVVAAAHGVSQECAAIKIPDLYGTVKSYEVGSEATSELPDNIVHAEGVMRAGWNAGVAHTAHFLAPVQRLQVSPTPGAALPELARGGERTARAVANAVVDGAAALAKLDQQAAAGVRDVCVAIGPAVAQGADAARQAGRAAEGAVHDTTKAAVDATADTINSLQRQLVEQINAARRALNLGFAEAGQRVKAGLGSAEASAGTAATKGVGRLLDHVSQPQVQALIAELMQLLRAAYMACLAVNWTQTGAHPSLLKKNVKASVGAVLGRGQPREPWQDVHCRITGPSVYDVAMNFIRRWNACQAQYLSEATVVTAGRVDLVAGAASGNAVAVGEGAAMMRAPALIAAALLQTAAFPTELTPKAPVDADPPAKPVGMAVRVLRSAPLKLRQQEAAAMKEKLVGAEQHEIQSQMINLISGATDFIYIENQFFQSGFGKASFDVFSDEAQTRVSAPLRYLMDKPGNRVMANLSSLGKGEGRARGKNLAPQNAINEALGDRITEAVRTDQPFHVYMVLPVHPEGMLNDIAVIGQIHWTMQSLVFADFSLINRIRRAIAARKICSNVHGNAQWAQALQDAGAHDGRSKPLYDEVTAEQWGKYLTLLNLRNCEVIDGVVRTEQIYVHSKLLIVDDRHVILGSANINDRSQSGHRDSEIAMVVFDTDQVKKPLRDAIVTVSPSVRDFRIRLWKKHFAITGGGNAIVRPATVMSEMIEKPAAQTTIQAIQELASSNSKSYRTVFPFVPWSEKDKGASLWPVCAAGSEVRVMPQLAAQMPFDERFWMQDGSNPEAPSDIKGFFSAFPVNWTLGEYNHPGNMNEMLLTENSEYSRSVGVA